MMATRSPRAAVVAASVLALLASVVPTAPVAAQQPTPAAPVEAPGTPIALSLEQALALVGERSEAVRAAAAGVQRAEGQLRQTRAQYFPQLSGTASYQRTLQSQFEAIASSAPAPAPDPEPDPDPDEPGDDPIGNISRIFASENTVVLGLQLNQNVYTGGRIGALARASEAGRRAAELGVTAATAQAQLDVTQAYFDALLAERLVAIAESSLVQTERTFRQASLTEQVGTTAEFDRLRAQVTRDNQRPIVLQARTQRDAALLRLRQLLDVPLERPLRLTTDLEAGVPPQLVPAAAAAPATITPGMRIDAPVDVDALLADRPASVELVGSVLASADTSVTERVPVRQAEENVRAQEQLLRATRAQRLPALALSSTYQRFAYPIGGVPGLDDFFPNWTVSVGLSLPILTGGRIRGESQAAEANVVEARAQMRQTDELAALDAQLAVDQLQQAAAAYGAVAGTAEQATRAYAIAEVRFREGISTQVELDDARLLQQQALANRAQAARDLSVARARVALLEALPLGAGTGAGQSVTPSGGTNAGQGGATTPGGQGGTGRSATSAGGAGGFTQAGQPGGITP